MFKQKWLKKYTGTEANQEIYDWMIENCSDLFDSITIDEDLSRVRCYSGNTEIFRITAGTTGYNCNLYWKNSTQFTVKDNSTYYSYIRGIYRITNGILFQFVPYDLKSLIKSVPAVGVIKNSNDYIGIFTSHDGSYYQGTLTPHLTMSTTNSTLFYKLHSNNNGNGSSASKSIRGYYSNMNDKVMLSPMVCTNSEATPTEVVYWLESGMNKDVGLMTIGGNEYFSNGIFCVLN